MSTPTVPEIEATEREAIVASGRNGADRLLRRNYSIPQAKVLSEAGAEDWHIRYFVGTFLAISFVGENPSGIEGGITRKDKIMPRLSPDATLKLAHLIMEASDIQTEDPAVQLLLGDHATNGSAQEQELDGSVDPMEYEHGIASLVQTMESLYSEELVAISRDAKCIDADPEAFFPEKGGSTKEAKKICAECPVRKPCLDYAMEHNERFGIWGGLSERERRRRKQQEGDIQPKTPATADAV